MATDIEDLIDLVVNRPGTKIGNISSGLDPARVQQNEDKPYFLCWEEDREQKIAFFALPYYLHEWKERLKEMEKNQQVTNNHFIP